MHARKAKLWSVAAVALVAAVVGPGREARGGVVYNLSKASGTSVAGTADPHTAAGPLTATGVVSSADAGHFWFSGWGSSFDAGKYLQATMSADAGFRIDLDDISFSVESEGGGTSAFRMASSLDGYAGTIDAFAVTGDSVTNHTTSLASLPPVAGTLSFRFYGTTTSDVVRFGFANHLTTDAGVEVPGRNVQFDGAAVPDAGPVAAAPLPGAAGGGLALSGIVGGTVLLARRRKPAAG